MKVGSISRRRVEILISFQRIVAVHQLVHGRDGNFEFAIDVGLLLLLAHSIFVFTE